MSRAEQEQVQAAYYQEANRYLQNARETLQKAGKEGNYYQDEKYVKTACGTAYNGVLKAIDGYFLLKNPIASSVISFLKVKIAVGGLCNFISSDIAFSVSFLLKSTLFTN